MLRRVLTYGTVAGAIVGVPLSALTIAMNGHALMSYGMVIGYTLMLIALSTVFVAIKRHRDGDLGGVITFWPAFGLGLGISFVAGIFYVVAWEAAVAVTHSDFATAYANAHDRPAEGKGRHGRSAGEIHRRAWNGSRCSTPTRSTVCR